MELPMYLISEEVVGGSLALLAALHAAQKWFQSLGHQAGFFLVYVMLSYVVIELLHTSIHFNNPLYPEGRGHRGLLELNRVIIILTKDLTVGTAF